MTETTRPQRMHARRMLAALAGAGIIREDDYVRRVIIDIDLNCAVVIYVERYGDERLLDLIRTLDGAEIRTGHPADGEEGAGTVTLTSDEVLLLRQRLSDGPGTPAVDSALDEKLYLLHRELRGDRRHA